MSHRPVDLAAQAHDVPVVVTAGRHGDSLAVDGCNIAGRCDRWAAQLKLGACRPDTLRPWARPSRAGAPARAIRVAERPVVYSPALRTWPPVNVGDPHVFL
jgi:hypothetical protein